MTIQITIENVAQKTEHLRALLVSAQNRVESELDAFHAYRSHGHGAPNNVLEDLATANARVRVLARAVEMLSFNTYTSSEDALEDIAMTLLMERHPDTAEVAAKLAREILFSRRINF